MRAETPTARAAEREPGPPHQSLSRPRSRYNPKLYAPTGAFPKREQVPPPLLAAFERSRQRIFLATRAASDDRPAVTPCNVSPTHRRALKRLMDDHTLVLCAADKGLGPVIIATAEYRRLARTLLDNPKVYTTAAPDFTALMLRITAWAQRLGSNRRRISASEEKFLRASPDKYDSIPAFKILIKLHKTPIAPRPIVPCRGSITEHVARWLSCKLGPIVAQQPSVVTSTAQVVLQLEKLNQSLPARPGRTWSISTFDVEALYTSIPVQRAARVVSVIAADFYAPGGPGHISGELSPLAEDYMVAMQIIADGTFLTFEDTIYKQCEGLAMGSPASGEIANIYLSTLEHPVIEPLLRSGTVIFYCRYIDDAVAIIEREHHARVSTQITNMDNSGTIRLTTSGQCASVDYLDLVVAVSDRGRVTYKCHQKALNSYLYIPYHSFQPHALQKGWIRAELLRYALNCMRHEDYQELCAKFSARLEARGYPKRMISKIFKSTRYAERHRVLRPSTSRELGGHGRLRHRKDTEQQCQQGTSEHTATPWIFKVEYSPIMAHPSSTRRVLQTELAAVQEAGAALFPGAFAQPPVLSLKRPSALGDEIASVNRDRFATLADSFKRGCIT